MSLLYFIRVVFFLISSTSVYSQVVSSDSLQHYAGKDEIVKVCDEVTGVFKSKSSNTFINFAKPFPKQKFSAVIFAGNLIHFDEKAISLLKNKYICITGKVKIYKDKPEIVLYKHDQIIEFKE